MSSIKKNLGFQTAYQLLATIMPLITSPYLSRVLGAAQIGIFSYTYAVVQYFILAAMLGTMNYGTRSIAACKDDPEQCGRTFINIYALQVLMSTISTIFYILYIVLFCKENKLIAAIQLIQILNCFLDINWLFFGLEEFKITVTRNFIVKLLSFMLLFVLVHSEEDLWAYTLLMAGSTLLSQIVLWTKLPAFCKKQKVRWNESFKTMPPNIVLFIPLLAMSVYHIMDKTMLGALSTEVQSGYYYNADKLINIPLTIISGFGAVLLPRVTNLLETGQKEAAGRVFQISIEGVILASAAMAFGIAGIANEFVPLFFGEGYEPCIELTAILAPVLIIKGISNTIRTEYLIPYHMERKLTTAVVLGAVVNFFVNMLLIPGMGAKGAAVGTVCAEAVACCWQIFSIRKNIKLEKSFAMGLFYVAVGFVMVATVRKIAALFTGALVAILAEVIVGGCLYVLLCFVGMKLLKSDLLKAVARKNVV